MKKYAQKRIDMYDIGNGLTLMNVINKNENGKLHQITTYIGIEGNGFVCVGNANDLDAPVFFASTFWTKLQNIFGHYCKSKLDKVAKVVYRLSGTV